MSLWCACRKLVFNVALVAATLTWSDLAAAASLKLTWKDNSTAESGFKIERLTGTTYVQIATVGANVLSYIDSGLSAGSTYCYRVRAFNTTGTSSPSNIACGVARATTSTMNTAAGTSTETTKTAPPPPLAGSGIKWSDYRFSLKLRSTDNDIIGVMFRYQDNDNYYRFSWDAQGKSRRLEKKVGGLFRVLAQQKSDSAAYRIGTTYVLEIVAQGSSLKVKINGAQIFAVTDTSLTEGTIALYSHYNTGAVFDDVLVEDLFTRDVLLSDNFDDRNFIGWTILDDGTVAGPSSWSAASQSLIQSSNIGSADPQKLGTYALYTKGSWKDYRLTLKLRSTDNDDIGVIFRYQDSDNYYRLSWGQQIPGRRLVKRQKGVFTALAQDVVPYRSGQTYLLEIVVRGSAIEVSVNGSLIFSVTDTAFNTGTIALYSRYNQGSFFDDVLVEDLSTAASLLWADFNNGSLMGWTVIDEADGSESSDWRVVNGQLVQNSNIGSATADAGTFVLY